MAAVAGSVDIMSTLSWWLLYLSCPLAANILLFTRFSFCPHQTWLSRNIEWNNRRANSPLFVPLSFSQPLWLGCWLETWLSDDVSTMIVKYGGQRQNINRYLFKRKMLDGLQLLNFIKIQTDKCHINLTLTGNETRLLNKCCDEKHKKIKKDIYYTKFTCSHKLQWINLNQNLVWVY